MSDGMIIRLHPFGCGATQRDVASVSFECRGPILEMMVR